MSHRENNGLTSSTTLLAYCILLDRFKLPRQRLPLSQLLPANLSDGDAKTRSVFWASPGHQYREPTHKLSAPLDDRAIRKPQQCLPKPFYLSLFLLPGHYQCACTEHHATAGRLLAVPRYIYSQSDLPQSSFDLKTHDVPEWFCTDSGISDPAAVFQLLGGRTAYR